MSESTPKQADLRALDDPVVVVAFEGWGDAGAVSSGLTDHLAEAYDTEVAYAIDPDDFYDFQVARPVVSLDDGGQRSYTFPTTQFTMGKLFSGRDLLVVRGVEPSMRWRQFCALVVSAIRSAHARQVFLFGGLLADTPHTRPVPISVTTHDTRLAAQFDLSESTYEGPTGIVGVLADSLSRARIPAVSLWAAVPHYVSHEVCPKGTLALLSRLEEMVDESLELGTLPELAKAWERGVDRLTSEDSEVAEYVTTLEKQQDAAELPEATGDAIAAEFERYLRRRPGSES